MRLPKIRFRIRTLLLLVALVALGLFAHRIYRDGPEAHWLVLKLRYGNVAMRRSAALQARESEVRAMFLDLVARANRQTSNAQLRRRGRGAALLLAAVVHAAGDVDAECRANALRAVDVLACLYASESEKSLALRQILAATRDGDDSVRTAAVGCLAGLAERDTGAVLNAIESALKDRSVAVRETAARELGMLGGTVPATQSDAAAILIALLASREESRVRVKAAWAMCHFGADRRRHPPGAGPDVVPALVAALHDPHVDVRRAVTVILGLTTIDPRGGRISAWDLRKDSITPALYAAISDDDKTVQEDAALALFVLGKRDVVVIELIEQAAGDPARSPKSEFESALEKWRRERETKPPVDSAAPSGGT